MAAKEVKVSPRDMVRGASSGNAASKQVLNTVESGDSDGRSTLADG